MLITLLFCCFIATRAARHPYANTKGYDRHANVFSPSGELLQTSYAEEAASKGDTIVCIAASGEECGSSASKIVLGISSRPEDILLDRSGLDKVSKVDENMWVASAGLAGDGRALVRLARTVCASYRTKFGTAPTLQYLANVVGEMQHEFTLSGKERPYGVSLMFIGYDEGSTKPQMLVTRVDGTVSKWKAVSIGKHASSCMDVLTQRHDEQAAGAGSGSGGQAILSSTRAVEVVIESLTSVVQQQQQSYDEDEVGSDGLTTTLGESEDSGSSSSSSSSSRSSRSSRSSSDSDSDSAGSASEAHNKSREEGDKWRLCDIYLLERDFASKPATLRMFPRIRSASEVVSK